MSRMGSVDCIYARDGDGNRLFPPEFMKALREQVLEELQQKTPREYGLGRTRWRLADFIGGVAGLPALGHPLSPRLGAPHQSRPAETDQTRVAGGHPRTGRDAS